MRRNSGSGIDQDQPQPQSKPKSNELSPQEKLYAMQVKLFQVVVGQKLLDMMNYPHTQVELMTFMRLYQNMAYINAAHTQIPDSVRFRMMGQALINAYYAVRHSESDHLTLFGLGAATKTGDELQALINDNIQIHHANIKVVSSVHVNDKTLQIFNPDIEDQKVLNVCKKIKEIEHVPKSALDDLVLKVQLCYVDQAIVNKDDIYKNIAQVLVDACYVLERVSPKQKSDLHLIVDLRAILKKYFDITLLQTIEKGDRTPTVAQLIADRNAELADGVKVKQAPENKPAEALSHRRSLSEEKPAKDVAELPRRRLSK